jgi:protein-S-isoprenylcysteine O-methyltransferase Ste14
VILQVVLVMTSQHLVLSLLWIAFCFLHSLLAGTGVKKKIYSQMGSHSKFYRLYYTLFAFLSLGGVLYYQLTLDDVLLFDGNRFVFGLGLFVAVSGLVLMGICIRKYFTGLSGIKSLYEERPSASLHVTGVHRFMRHPLYLGTFAFIWGLFLLIPYASLLLSNTIITVYTLLGIELEEAKLIDEFGDDYRTYQKSVPKLIPSRKRSPGI